MNPLRNGTVPNSLSPSETSFVGIVIGIVFEGLAFISLVTGLLPPVQEHVDASQGGPQRFSAGSGRSNWGRFHPLLVKHQMFLRPQVGACHEHQQPIR